MDLARWSRPGQSSPGLEKLRSKIANNLNLGWKGFFTKGLRFAHASAASRLLLRDVNARGVGVRVTGLAPKIENRGGWIVLGDDVVFSSPVTATHIAMEPNAFLGIGSETFINDGVWLGCTERITIGQRVLLGPGVRIVDNGYHGVYARRRLPRAEPVAIGDDVWIASDAIILPGVTVGVGAVVGAHAVVTEDVPPWAVVAGNPARVVKTLDPARFSDVP